MVPALGGNAIGVTLPTSEFPQASVRHPPAMPFYMTEEQLACMAFDHKYASSGATLLDSTMQVMSGCGDRSGSRPR